ncbi:hypothetical protein HII31_06757, partial [Pseudocercospora fuligena]
KNTVCFSSHGVSQAPWIAASKTWIAYAAGGYRICSCSKSFTTKDDRDPQAQLGKVEVRHNSGFKLDVLVTSFLPWSMVVNSKCRLSGLMPAFRNQMVGAKEYARNGFGANAPFKAGRYPDKKFKPTKAGAWPRMTARAVSYWDNLVSGTNKRVSKAVANAKAQQTGGLARNREALARMGRGPKNAPRDVQDDDEEYEELYDGDDDDYVAAIQERDVSEGVPEDVEPSEDRYTELEEDDAAAGEQVEDLTTTSPHMKHPRDVDEEEDEASIEAREARKGKGRFHKFLKNIGRSEPEEDAEYVAKIKARGARKPYKVVGTSPPLPTEAPTVTIAAPKTAPSASVTGISKKHKHGKGRHPKHGASAKLARPTEKAKAYS